MNIMKTTITYVYVLVLTIITKILEPLFYTLAKKKAIHTNESLIVLCLAKNNAKQLQKTLKRFDKIKDYFTDFKVLVYENNSTDSTKDVLRKAKETYSFIEYYSFDYTDEELEKVATIRLKPSMKQCRIQHIAKGRNFLLEKVRDSFSTFSITLAFDSDVFYFNPYKIVSAVATFNKNECNVLSVNGLTKVFKYRDAYAFRSNSFPYGPEYLGQTWWSETVHQIQKRYKSNQLLPVYSAFGGAALYNTNEYVKGNYSALHTDTSLKVQKEISEVNPSSTRTDAAPINSPVENTNYTGPVVCEHVPFHYTFYKQGFTKQFIDTSWKMLFL